MIADIDLSATLVARGRVDTYLRMVIQYIIELWMHACMHAC